MKSLENNGLECQQYFVQKGKLLLSQSNRQGCKLLWIRRNRYYTRFPFPNGSSFIRNGRYCATITTLETIREVTDCEQGTDWAYAYRAKNPIIIMSSLRKGGVLPRVLYFIVGRERLFTLRNVRAHTHKSRAPVLCQHTTTCLCVCVCVVNLICVVLNFIR